MKQGTVLLADRHAPLLEAVRSILEEYFDAVVMVAEQRAFLTALECLQPKVVVMDIAFPNLSTSLLEILRDRFPQVRVIVLSVHDEMVAVERILSLGAAAFVLKRSAVNDLPNAIAETSEGRRYVSADTQDRYSPSASSIPPMCQGLGN